MAFPFTPERGPPRSPRLSQRTQEVLAAAVRAENDGGAVDSREPPATPVALAAPSAGGAWGGSVGAAEAVRSQQALSDALRRLASSEEAAEQARRRASQCGAEALEAVAAAESATRAASEAQARGAELRRELERCSALVNASRRELSEERGKSEAVRESALRTLEKAEGVLRAREGEVRALKAAVETEAQRAQRAEAKLKAAKERLETKSRELECERRRAEELNKRNGSLLALNSRLLASSAPSAETVRGARMDASRQIGRWAREGEALAASMGERQRGHAPTTSWGGVPREAPRAGTGGIQNHHTGRGVEEAAWEERVLRLEVQAAALLAH